MKDVINEPAYKWRQQLIVSVHMKDIILNICGLIRVLQSYYLMNGYSQQFTEENKLLCYFICCHIE